MKSIISPLNGLIVQVQDGTQLCENMCRIQPDYNPEQTFRTVEGAWFYGRNNLDLTVNTNGTGGLVADGGKFGRYSDRSGYGNHMTEATANIRPVWKDGRVRFYWATHGGTRHARIANAATATTWLRQNMSGAVDIDVPGVNSSVILDHGLSQFAPFLGDGGSAQYPFVRYHDGVALNNTTLRYRSRHCIIGWRCTATEIIFNVDGVEQILPPESAVTMTRLIMGCFNGGALPTPMIHYEAVSFAADVGAATFANLLAYLNRQAQTELLDPTKVWLNYGDSLMMGVGSELGKPAIDYVTNRSTSVMYTFARDGGRLATPDVSAATLISYKGSAETIAVIWIGTGDIAFGAQTGASMETLMWNLTDQLVAEGIKPIVCTLQDFSYNRAQKDDFNARIMANAAAHSVYPAPLHLEPELSDSSNLLYFTDDTVHGQDALYAIAGGVIQATAAAIP